MNLRTRFRYFAGLAVVISIVVAEGVAAHSPLPAAPDLPLLIDGPNDRAALAPYAFPYRRWDPTERTASPQRAPFVPGAAQLLPNWEVGRSAAMLLPNYEPGMATFELLDIGAISGTVPPLVAPRAAPANADKP